MRHWTATAPVLPGLPVPPIQTFELKTLPFVSSDRGERFADAHGNNSSERSTNRSTAGRVGWKINYRNANGGGFGSGNKTSRAKGCESARNPWQRRAGAQSCRSAALSQTIRGNSRLESEQITRGTVRERDRRENDVGRRGGPRGGCRGDCDKLEDVDLARSVAEIRLSRERDWCMPTRLA